MALDYINHKGLRPPKPLLKAVEELINRDDIVVTKPDNSSGVVVMEKSENLRLLSEASIKNRPANLVQLIHRDPEQEELKPSEIFSSAFTTRKAN